MMHTHSWRYLGLVSLLVLVPACISAEPIKTPPGSSGAGSVGGYGAGSTGGAMGAGGDANTSVASGEGGNLGTGGDSGTGGVIIVTGGGHPATGGAPPETGGAASETGGAPNAGTGGEAAAGSGGASVGTNPSCDFANAACQPNPCDGFTGSVSWKLTPCKALLDCLQASSACITADDPLCGPEETPYLAPTCGGAYYNIASDPDVPGALTTYVKCACGL